jgi:signal transduction histidine kinase
VAREAITNALVHANASHIALDLHFRESAFALSIRDDGTGLDPRQFRDAGGNGHFGLQGMRERAMQIGGRLEIGGNYGVGTLVHLELPSPFAYVSDDRRLCCRSLDERAGRRRPGTKSDPLWALFTECVEDHEQAH